MSDFFDPLRDPRFPDRPQHPDFWKLSEILLKLDGAAQEKDLDLQKEIGKEIDPESLFYMVSARSQIATKMLGLPSEAKDAIGSAWMEGFIAGSRFNQKKGS